MDIEKILPHLSISSLNEWNATPRKWGLHYLKGEREDKPYFWRGNAVEHALELYLRGVPLDYATDQALGLFEQKALGDLSDDVQAERKLIAPMVKQAFKWQSPSALNATQLKIELHLHIIPIPIIGYIDFAFDGIDVDSKTGKKTVSAPSWKNTRQVALYRAARARRGALLYISPTGLTYFEIDDMATELAMASIEADALSLMKQLRRASDADDFIAALPDFEEFRKGGISRQMEASNAK